MNSNRIKQFLLVSKNRAILIAVVFVVGLFVVIGVRSYSRKTDNDGQVRGVKIIPKSSSPSPTRISTPVATASATPTVKTPAAQPTVDCVGPDGGHMFVTKDVCDNFNSAWAPTLTPTPTTAPASAPTETPTPTLTPTVSEPVPSTTSSPTEDSSLTDSPSPSEGPTL